VLSVGYGSFRTADPVSSGDFKLEMAASRSRAAWSTVLQAFSPRGRNIHRYKRRAGKQMKILGWVTITAITAATTLAGEMASAREHKVTICMDPSPDGMEIRSAQRLASKVFARIHVGVDWRELGACPVGGNAVQVGLSYRTPEHHLPGALAYALPYEGRHIVVFYDRLRESDPNQVTYSLAYVLVHEVTHILEGITRHSKRGIMKAQWDGDDRFEIAIGRLEFAPEDVDLIHRGMDARTAAPTLRALATAPPRLPIPLAAQQ
jgi:hypothetical protein